MPQPEGPMKAVTVCGAIARVTSRNARNEPYQASSRSILIRPFVARSVCARDRSVPEAASAPAPSLRVMGARGAAAR